MRRVCILALSGLMTCWVQVGVSAEEPVAEAEPEYDSGLPDMELYGFLRLDLILDDSAMSHPQYAMWVLSEGEGGEVRRNDSDLTVHPRLSRLGLQMKPYRPAEDVTLAAKLEVDFHNGGTESRQLLRLRYAYGSIRWKDLELITGQVGDLISPLYPAVHTDGTLWNAGNTGDRRPSVRLAWSPAVGSATLRVGAALAMTGSIDKKNLDGDDDFAGLIGMDGFDAATPTVQGLVELSVPLWTSRPLVVGLSGHWAREVQKLPIAGSTSTEQAYLGAHVVLPLLDSVTLKAEGFWGQNLSDVRGGIGQGVNPHTGEEIRAIGGWLELSGVVSSWLSLFGGLSIDDPDSDDLREGMRDLNWTLYALAHLRPWEPLKIGFEYMYWRTEYVARPAGDANRINLHVSYLF